MLSHKEFLYLFLMPFLLTSCIHIPAPATIQDRDSHYLTAQSIPPLRIPPGMNINGIHNEYPIASRIPSASDKKVSIIPPGL